MQDVLERSLLCPLCFLLFLTSFLFIYLVMFDWVLRVIYKIIMFS